MLNSNYHMKDKYETSNLVVAKLKWVYSYNTGYIKKEKISDQFYLFEYNKEKNEYTELLSVNIFQQL